MGRAPDEVAAEVAPQTDTIESDGPLMWSALDGGSRVIAAVFLGDAENADWQIFTCG